MKRKYMGFLACCLLCWACSVIIGKTKSTNFQNEKYKKGMSFKYYINGA